MQIPLAFLFGAPGGGEILLIFVVILLMFGPKRLPEMARNIGKAMDYLRKTSQEFKDQVMRLDEEVPKIVDSAFSDPSRIEEHTGSVDSSSGSIDTDPSMESNQQYDETGMPVKPVIDEIVSMSDEVQEKEQNAAKIDSNAEGGAKDIPGPEGSGTSPSGGRSG